MIVLKIGKRSQIALTRGGLYVMFRCATETQPASGFIIKRASHMLFSERHGRRRGLRLGPIYLRTMETFPNERAGDASRKSTTRKMIVRNGEPISQTSGPD